VILLFALGILSRADAPRTLSEIEIREKLKLYADIHSLAAPFKQVKTVLDPKFELKSEGTLRVVRPDFIEWTVTKPSFLQMILEGNRVVMKTGEGAGAKIQQYSLNGMLDDKAAKGLVGLLAWLQLDVSRLIKEYSFSYLPEGTLVCTPVDKNASLFSSLEMKLDRQGAMSQLKIAEKSGDQLLLNFGKPTISRK